MKLSCSIEPLESRIAPAFAPVVNLGNIVTAKTGMILLDSARNDAFGTSVSDGRCEWRRYRDIIVGVPNWGGTTLPDGAI